MCVCVCGENRLCRWVAVCVYLTCLLCNSSVKCIKWEWRTHPSLSSYKHCGCDAQIWTHSMPVSVCDIRDDVSGLNVMNLTLEADTANQVHRTIFTSLQRRKWGRRVVLIMRSCYHNDTSSQLATDSVSTSEGSFWHQRLWGVEMDAAALNVICFTVKCSHLAFFIFIEELTRYDRLGQTKTELMSWQRHTTTGKTCSTVLHWVLYV